MRRLLALLATDPNIPFLHAPAEVGAEPVYASRSVTGMYRTSPLRGIWQHPPYFHDGSAADLLAVVNHYDEIFSLHLGESQKADLVEFLKSLCAEQSESFNVSRDEFVAGNELKTRQEDDDIIRGCSPR